jgi:hypothetical protein
LYAYGIGFFISMAGSGFEKHAKDTDNFLVGTSFHSIWVFMIIA